MRFRLDSADRVISIQEAHACIADDLKEVEQCLRIQLGRISSDDGLMEDIMDAFFSAGGKRLRPRLVLLSAFGAGGATLPADTRKIVMSLATIVELVHSASLMHDDVLDRAATRRGRESLNARFGDKVAILAGDILYSHAFEMLIESADKLTTRQLIYCVRNMCRGEVVNLTCRGLDAYEGVIEDKTARLMEFCCEAGARAALGADAAPDQVEIFRQFGHSYGMVYQLADDLDDADVNPNAATPTQIRERLAHYKHLAVASLCAMSPSPYRDGLTALLRTVAVTDCKPEWEVSHSPRVLVGAGA